METEKKSKELSIQDIMYVLLDHKKLIIISMLVCYLLCFVYFGLMSVPMYSASSVLYVSCMTPEELSASTTGISSYEIDSSRALSTTYIEILQGRSFLKLVSADLNYRYTPEELARMISIVSMNETELLRVTVVNASAEDAFLICRSINDNAPKRLLNIFSRGTVSVVDEVEMPQVASSASMKKIFVVGMGMGFVLGAAIAFVINIFDTKIKSPEELCERYDITVVGHIL